MELNQEVHLSHYWNVIYKRWKVAVSIVAVVMFGAFIVSYFSKPLYRSTIQIQIERENPNQLTVEDLFGIASSDQEFMQTQYVLLKSRGLADRVIRDSRLLEDKDFYPSGIAGKSQAEIDKIREGMVGAILGTLDVTPVRNTSMGVVLRGSWRSMVTSLGGSRRLAVAESALTCVSSSLRLGKAPCHRR